MSWDAMILRQGGSGSHRPLGFAGAIKKRLSMADRQIQWEGFLGRLGGIELAIWSEAGPVTGASMEVDVIHITVRGEESPLPRLLDLAHSVEGELFDCQTGLFGDPRMPSGESWEEFERAREELLGDGGPSRRLRLVPAAGDPARPRRRSRGPGDAIMIYRLLDGPPAVVALPEPSFMHLPLGAADMIRALFDSVFPGLVWSGPEAAGSGGEVDLVLASEGIVDVVAVYPRDLSKVIGLCEVQGWSAYDCATGEFRHLQRSAR